MPRRQSLTTFGVHDDRDLSRTEHGVHYIWLCAELGIEYRVIDVDFSASYRSPGGDG